MAERRVRAWSVTCDALALVGLGLTFSGALFSIDGSNLYHRTALFPIAGALVVTMLAVGMALVALHRRQLGRRSALVMGASMLLTAAACAIQAFSYGPNLGMMALTASAFMLFAELQGDASRNQARQQRQLARAFGELKEARLQAAADRIEPHFMGNTLGAIHYLSLTDPPQAARALELLSDHMRGVTHALGAEECIPVDDEMAHVRDYLELRRMVAPDELDYRIDGRVDGFRVPPLCVLTLVENAVEHGVLRAGGGTVAVSTREDDGRFEVEVADDGAGFDPASAPGGGRAHVGIANARFRIEAMCGGALSVESEPGRGTRAVISIPKDPGERRRAG